MTARRKLSVHVEHELLLKLEAAGFDEASAQKVIQSKGNRLAKKFADSLKSPQALTWAKTQGLVGTGNFFGPQDWAKFFGSKFKIAAIPEIPWSEAELENPGIRQEHFLFLGLNQLGGKPLNLPAWHNLCPGENHPKFYLDWYLTHDFAKKTCRLRWYLMPIGIMEGSRSLSFDNQVAMLPDKYEVSIASARVTANILYYLLNKKYLDADYWARTSDKSDGGDRVGVRGHSDYGLYVRNWDDDAYDSIGVSASRKS
jgi:hypothetical protein